LVDGRWVPSFPRARYVMGRAELAHWQDPALGPSIQPEGVPAIRDSVDPVVEAGVVELADAGDEVARGVRLEAVPGHTPHQLAVRIGVPGADGLFTADVFHQPMQIYRTDWNSRYCEVPDAAIATRRRVFAAAAEAGTVLFPSHTGAPHAGRVVREAGGFAFVPLQL
jgi:glyoxylase-like metal-dependent hydrolase (beta-lactamase superfamily II)